MRANGLMWWVPVVAFSAGLTLVTTNSTKKESQPTVLIVTMPGGEVRFQEFSARSRCTEAAAYIQMGTTRGAITECVKK